MKRFIVIILTLTFLQGVFYSVQAGNSMPEFLCETGVKFYKEGRYEEALSEFKKALIVRPGYAPALQYIRMIEQILFPEEALPAEEAAIEAAPEINVEPEQQAQPNIDIVFPKGTVASYDVAGEALDLFELQKEMISERRLTKPAAEEMVASIPMQEGLPPVVIALDDSLKNLPVPIEIEQDKSYLLSGNNIKRFLCTNPEIIDIKKVDPSQLLVTARGIGYTYLTVWDSNGRWTTEWMGIFPKPEGLTYEELARKEEEKQRNFRLRYSLNWYSYESGRRLNSELRRSSYNWTHTLSLNGPTPYGDIDSAFTVQDSMTSTDLTYFTFGLTNGQWGNLKGFSLRGMDYTPGFTNLTFPGDNLRGVKLYSPLLNEKFDYTLFWGRNGGGRFGNLSPGLYKIQSSYLAGTNIGFTPTNNQDYRLSVIKGWGRDRGPGLETYGFDLTSSISAAPWRFFYDIANNTRYFAQVLRANIAKPKGNFSVEFRDIDKYFTTISSTTTWRQGELGGLLTFGYAPNEKLSFNTSLDIYKDRLNPAEDNPDRLNEDFNLDSNYYIDDTSSLHASYFIQNELGRFSQFRSQGANIGITKRFKFINDVYTYLNYYFQSNKSYSAPASDYISDRIIGGLRFNLIGQLYYYLTGEQDFVNERYYATHSQPYAIEQGFDWSDRIFKSPFFGTCRFTYRDEQDTIANLPFLSGQDYIEGYAELAFRPEGGVVEVFGNARIRNVWADNPSVNKHVEADFNAGLRYNWDTGFRWDSVGNVEGYIFKDFNYDGLRQRDEPPVEGIKVWFGKDKSRVTDIFGYYKFSGVKGKKAYVTLDASSLPAGFVLTVPATQEFPVANHRTSRVDFGIISRTEISGFIFEDTDTDNEFDHQEKGVSGVEVSLEDGSKVVTDGGGRYSFKHPACGEHQLLIDINTIPVYFLPKVTLNKKITLYEGTTYIYNVPLQRVEE